MSFRKLIAFLVTILIVINSYAEEYKYHPRFSPTLGKSFDILNPLDAKQATYFTTPNTKNVVNDINNGIQKIELELKFIKDKSYLFEYLNIDGNIEHSIGVKSGKISGKYLKTKTSDKKNLIVALRSKIIFTTQRFKNGIRFTQKGKQDVQDLIKIKNYQGIINSIGTDVITEVKKGCNICFLYTFTSSKSSSLEALENNINLEWQGGKADINLNKIKNSVNTNISMSFKAVQFGASLRKNVIDGIDVKIGDTSGIKKVLKESLKALNPNNVPIISFTTSKLINLSLFNKITEYKKLQDIMSTHINKLTYLEKVYKHLVNVESQLDFQKKLNEMDISNSVKEKVLQNIKKLQDIKEKIKELHKRILAHNKKGNIDTNLDIPKYPTFLKEIELIQCQKWTYSIWSKQQGKGFWTPYVTIKPVITLVQPSLIRKFYIRLNNEVCVNFSKEDMLNAITQQKLECHKDVYTGIGSPFFTLKYNQTIINQKQSKLLQSVKNEQSKLDYILEVVLIDGTSRFFSLGNISNNEKGTITKEIFPNKKD